MWERSINQETGRRIHLAVAFVVSTGGGPADVPAAVAELFAAQPLGGAVEATLRSRCTSLATRYLAMCVPVGWDLVGVEEMLRGSKVDFVWQQASTGRKVGEELKTGRAALTSQRVAAQVAEHAAGGSERWSDGFAGVRVITLSNPARSWMARIERGQLRRVALCDGLEVRT